MILRVLLEADFGVQNRLLNGGFDFGLLVLGWDFDTAGMFDPLLLTALRLGLPHYFPLLLLLDD